MDFVTIAVMYVSDEGCFNDGVIVMRVVVTVYVTKAVMC